MAYGEKSKKYIDSVRELEVFRRAYAISLEVHKESLAFPKIEQYALASQMRRASKSICANLTEGFAKQSHSKLEFARFISMAIGSCGEMDLWISYCHDLGYIDTNTLSRWLNEYNAITCMLIALRSKIHAA